MVKVFGQTDTSFLSNGDVVLRPLKARVHNEDNGSFYLDLETGLEYVDYLVEGNIVVANTPMGDQAFRITSPTKTKHKISVKAKHVFFDSQNYLIEDAYVVNKNCNEALAQLNGSATPQSPFTTMSDITSINSFRCVRKSLYEAIMSVVERWGGHLARDNWNAQVRASIGSDKGVTISYGKNLKDITSEEDWGDVVTQLLPVGKDGIMLNSIDPTASKYVISETQYPIPYCKTVSFTQDISQADYPTEAAYKAALVADLQTKAQAYVDDHCVPKVNYSLSAVNVDASIGDTIAVEDERLGITILTNVIAYDYDCISERIVNLEFGNFRKTISNLIPSLTVSMDKKVAESQGFLEQELKDATDIIIGMMGNGYVIYNGSYMMAVDRLPKETAQNCIIFNNGGIGFSTNGISGPFNSAWTIDGTLDMQYINCINLLANVITSGLLKDKTNTNFWNLDTGEFQLQAYPTKTEAQGYASSAVNSFVDNQYAQDIADLQSQIDGQIETYFDNYVPTLNNAPANSWTTTTDKDNHLGDLFYVMDNPDHGGECYRFAYINGVYQWQLVEDSAVATAIQMASDAEALAGEKKRVFITTPTTPYDVGDLWMQGANGDILVCKTARTTGSYTASDWELASKYTSDAAFIAFRDGTYATFVTNTNNAIAAKITTYYQASAPTNHNTGDLWIDTDDGNKLYRWSGSAWTSVQDTAIQTALTNAATAQSTADGKIVTYAQPSAPSGSLDTGDLWIDTDANNKLYRWSGSAWVAYTDSSALAAFQNGTYATFVANTNTALGKKITTFYQANSPTANVVGDLWIDTDDGNKLYRWNGSSWANVQDTGIQTALANAATAQSTADGKIVTYAQTTAPTSGLDVGDLWIDTDDNNKMYRWNGSSWVNMRDATIAIAQETANVKRRCFVTTPVPPYDVGDLWTNGSDLYRCKTAKSGGSYSASDWELATNYVDSGDVSSAISAFDNTLNQQAIFNKLTNNGALQGIYMQNGNLYINATYIASGTINADLITAGTIRGIALAGNTITSQGTYASGIVGEVKIYGGTMETKGTDTEEGISYKGIYEANGITLIDDSDASDVYRAYYLPDMAQFQGGGKTTSMSATGITTSGEINTKKLEVEKHVFTDISVKSGSPAYLEVGSYGAYWSGICVGMAQGVGPVIIGLTYNNGTLTRRNLMTNSSWSNNALQFSCSVSGSTATLTISSNNSNVSKVSLFIG